MLKKMSPKNKQYASSNETQIHISQMYLTKNLVYKGLMFTVRARINITAGKYCVSLIRMLANAIPCTLNVI